MIAAAIEAWRNEVSGAAAVATVTSPLPPLLTNTNSNNTTKAVAATTIFGRKRRATTVLTPSTPPTPNPKRRQTTTAYRPGSNSRPDRALCPTDPNMDRRHETRPDLHTPDKKRGKRLASTIDNSGVDENNDDEPTPTNHPANRPPSHPMLHWQKTQPPPERKDRATITTQQQDGPSYTQVLAHAQTRFDSFDPFASNRPSSVSTGGSNGNSNRRSRSPVKGMFSLRFASKPVEIHTLRSSADAPEDILGLCRRIRDIYTGRDVVPADLADQVASRLERTENDFAEPLDYSKNVASADSRLESDTVGNPDDNLKLMNDLDDIIRQTQRAQNGSYSEAHWNERVHSRMLAAAIETGGRYQRSRGTTEGSDTAGRRSHDNAAAAVGFLNITSATIAKACVPAYQHGLDVQSKMVDYCLYLGDNAVSSLSRRAVALQPEYLAGADGADDDDGDAQASVSTTSETGSNTSSRASKRRRTTRGLPPQSINHTEYDPLCVHPIFASIETKKPGGSEDMARAQLSIWASAHFIRLHQLLDGVDAPAPLDITLPLLYVAGPQWQILFARETETGIQIWQFLKVDGTGDWLGAFKVRALVRAVCDWGVERFQVWFLERFGMAAGRVGI